MLTIKSKRLRVFWVALGLSVILPPLEAAAQARRGAPARAAPPPRATTAEPTRQEAREYTAMVQELIAATGTIPQVFEELMAVLGAASQDVLILPLDQREAMSRQWITRVGAKTSMISNRLRAIRFPPATGGFAEQINGARQTRDSTIALLSGIDASVQRLASLVTNVTAENQEQTVASIRREIFNTNANRMRSMASINVTYAANLPDEAPSKSSAIATSYVYRALATVIDAQAGTVTPDKARESVVQFVGNLRQEIRTGRARVRNAKEQFATNARNPRFDQRTRDQFRRMGVIFDDYNAAFNISDQMAAKLTAIAPLIRSEDPASIEEMQRLLIDIGNLEREQLPLVNGVPGKMAALL